MTTARRPRLWPWIAAMAVGAALGANGVWLYVSAELGALFEAHLRLTPLDVVLHLDTGRYYVCEHDALADVRLDAASGRTRGRVLGHLGTRAYAAVMTPGMR